MSGFEILGAYPVAGLQREKIHAAADIARGHHTRGVLGVRRAEPPAQQLDCEECPEQRAYGADMEDQEHPPAGVENLTNIGAEEQQRDGQRHQPVADEFVGWRFRRHHAGVRQRYRDDQRKHRPA